MEFHGRTIVLFSNNLESARDCVVVRSAILATAWLLVLP